MSARHRGKKRLAVPGWHSIAGDRFKISALQKSHQHRQQLVPSIRLCWSR